MNYPIRLLPDKHFNKISWHKDLNNQYLIRYTDNDDYIDDDGKVKASSLTRRTDHLRDYSTYMLGKFIVEDIFIEITDIRKEYFTSEWNEGESVLVPIFNKDFIINHTRGFFFFCIGDLNNVELSKYDDITAVKPYCFILHTPTNCNFWHFSIRWFHDGADILSWPEKKRRRILSSAKTFLIERAIIREPVFQELEEFHYFN